MGFGAAASAPPSAVHGAQDEARPPRKMIRAKTIPTAATQNERL